MLNNKPIDKDIVFVKHTHLIDYVSKI